MARWLWPSRFSERRALRPAPVVRAVRRARASTEIGSGDMPCPYSTAGIRPVWRSRPEGRDPVGRPV